MGQPGVGEGKGFVNFAAGAAVYLYESPHTFYSPTDTPILRWMSSRTGKPQASKVTAAASRP